MAFYHSTAATSNIIPTATKFCLLFSLLMGMVSAQLSSDNFYATSCPKALSTIKSGVDSAVQTEKRMGASLLRLHFHDCFVNVVAVDRKNGCRLMSFQELSSRGRGSKDTFITVNSIKGCDASVLLDGPNSEKLAAPNNNSIRGFDVIDSIKSEVEKLCPGVVSCADILAVVARDSVVALSGPSWSWKVRLGRRDSATPGTANIRDIPAPTSNLSGLITSFSNKGLTAQEMVALSGSHTVGQARCVNFRTRIYNETNIDSSFAASLKSNCPSTGGDDNLSPLDTTSPTSFDNAYFQDLKDQKGLLHSDQQLFNGGSTDAQVNGYISDPGSFITDFANAMVKMGNLSPLTGTNGQIRTNCRSAN